jgi:hypothetical protein
MIEYSPDPDVRLIQNVWARKGVLERVWGVKYMWGLFACNELLHRPFWHAGLCLVCSCCTNTTHRNQVDAVHLRKDARGVSSELGIGRSRRAAL